MTTNNSFDLNGRVAIVTGGAGWIGKSLCESLAKYGASVVVASRHNDQCQQIAQALQAREMEAVSVPLDVTDEKSVLNARDKILARYGHIDILVNNAGVATNQMIEHLSVAEWNRVMGTNATGTFICCKVFAPAMIEAGGGSIINVSSIYGKVAADQRIYGDTGRNSSLVYAASKAAIIEMTRYLAVYWADSAIRVNCISPGGVARNQENDFIERYNARVPLGRMANQADLGGAVVFLASDAASYITGQNLMIDGGWTAW